MSTVRLSFVRDTSRLNNLREIHVESGWRKRTRYATFAGTPLQLSRVLPSVRYAIRKMNGIERRTYLRSLANSFRDWQSKQ